MKTKTHTLVETDFFGIKKRITMKTKSTIQRFCCALILVLGMAMNSVFAQTPLFSQNFNSSSTLSTYVNSSSPNNGQFNAISVSSGTTATITSSALQFVRSGSGTGTFSRSSSFSANPLGMIYKFDLTVLNSSSTGSVARWQVGEGFGTGNSAENSNDCYAQFAIDFRSGNNYRINDISNGSTSANITGTIKTVTWVLNKSGNTLSYNAPDGTVKTVQNNKTDIWVGTTRYISGANIEDSGNDLDDLKFTFSNSSGTIIMDNILITQYIPIVTSQPAASQTVCSGSSVSFTAAASGLPTPTVKWQKFISSVWTDISGATSNTYTISSPLVGDAGQFRALYTNSEGSTPSNTSTLTVNQSSVGGSVTSNASVCSGSNSGILALSGHTGNVTKWQSSINGGSNWSDITNTTATQNYNNLSTSTMYRAVIQNGSCPVANSAAATITVNPTTSISTQPTDKTACVGENTTISLVAAGGSLTYEWQDNSSGSFAAISGATSATLSLNGLTAGMNGRRYMCIVSGTCGSATSNTIILTVNPASIGGAVGANAAVCSGLNSGTLTLSAHTGNVTKWQSSTNGGSSWSDITNTTISQNYTNLTTTTMYRAVVQNGSCSVANSTPATITVNALPTLYTVTGGGAYCPGGSGAVVGLSDSQSGVNYQLMVGGSNTGAPVAGTGNAISFGANATVGTYTVVATNSSTSCTNSMTGSVTVSTNPVPSVSLAASPNPSCYQSTLTATISGGTMGTISASNNSSVIISPFGTPTVTRTITMPAGIMTAASNITLTMDIDHSRAGNLIATLISPSCGQSVIFNRPGGTSNQDNLIGSYVFKTSNSATFPGSNSGDVPTGNYQATFSGLTYACSDVAGTWTLQIQDMENSGGGTLNSWSLSISNAAGGYTTVFSGPATIGTVTNSGNTASALITPPIGTSDYTAITTDFNGCASFGSNTVSVLINPTVSITTQPLNQVTCTGLTTQFDVVASGAGINYQWRKGTTAIVDGGRFAGANTATLTISNASALDAANDYNVVLTDASCSVTSANASLLVNNTPANPIANPTTADVLPGGIQMLSATNTTSSALGTGTLSNGSTSFSNPLGNYYGAARHQILVLASELTAMGIQSGEKLNSISFDVANKNGATAMTNYTISIGNTAQTTISSTFTTGLTQVYTSASYAPVTGLNSFNFSTSYTWNGTSNIIIETVYNNSNSGVSNGNCSVKYTSTASNSVNYSRADNLAAGNASILARSSDGTSTSRPNLVFGHTAASFVWTPITDLYTDAGATLPYSGSSASEVYSMPTSTTIYTVSTVGVGCNSLASATHTINFISTPPNCVSSTIINGSCITNTKINWTAATNYPSGYYVSVGTDMPPSDVMFYQDMNTATTLNLPTLLPNTTYYYQILPYNVNGENTACTISSFVSGASTAGTPTQALNSFSSGFEGTVAPALPCGITVEDENGDNVTWVTSTSSPRNGSVHMRIDKNTDNATGKQDWFYCAPMNVVAGKVYRIKWWTRIGSGTQVENYEVWAGSEPNSAVMQGVATNNIANRLVSSTSYVSDSASDYLVATTGQVHIGFRATGFAGRGSLYIDDIQIFEVPVAALNPASCTTIASMYDQIFVQPVFGATNYEYHLISTTPGENYDYRVLRNNGSPDYRLKWAPGVAYEITYNVSVKYYKNGIWSPEGAACSVSLGAFPQVKLRDNPLTPGLCDYTISDLNTLLRTDSVPGANDYQYKIEEEFPMVGYDYNQDWQRGNSNIDFRLTWATSSSVERVRYGYRYNVQSRALVGKTTSSAFGNRPGKWGTYGAVCKLDLQSASPTTNLVNCATVLANLGDAFSITPVAGASDYRYHITASGYDVTVNRGNANTDYRLTWIIGTGNPGVKYGTTYSVEVSAKVGGVYLNYGSICSISTPIAPSTSLLAVCGTTLLPGQFSSQLFVTAVAGATNYAYKITGAFSNGGTERIFYRNSGANDFKFSWTLQGSNLPNMMANTPYTVEVAYQAGGQWEAYGPACSVTTGASVPRYSPFESENMQETAAFLTLSVYPNPMSSSENYALELQGLQSENEKVQVSILNLMGQKVYFEEILTAGEEKLTIEPQVQLATGVYTAEANLGDFIQRVKFVVK